MNNHVFYDIFDYYELPFYQTILGQFIIVTAILISIVFIIYLFLIHRKKKTLLPWEWATKELQTLAVEKCITKEDYKKIYFRMSSILKNYLHKRFFWATIDKTDDELIQYLEQQKFDPSLLEMLKPLLEGAQWIKFANEDVLRNQATKDHATALLIIGQTTPTEQRTGK